MKQLVILFFLLLPTILFSQAHKWHGNHQDLKYPDTHLLDVWPNDTLVLVQTYRGMGEGYGSASINEAGIFVAGMQKDSTGAVYHFSHDGTLIWATTYGNEYTYKFNGSRGTPTLHEEKVYYAGTFGDVVCLDIKTGAKLWHKNIFDIYQGRTIKWGYTESPLIYKNLLILQPGGPEVSLCALNKEDGSVVWETNVNGSANAYCTPKLIEHANEVLCMVNMSDDLLIFQPEDGKIRFRHPLTNSRVNHTNENIYSNGQLFYTSGYGEGSVMFKVNDEKNSLDTIWQNTEFDSKMSGTIVVDSLIYGTADRGKMWAAIQWESGETVYETREIKPGSFVMADGKFYIFTEIGEIALAKPTPEGMEIINKFNCPEYPTSLAFSHPVIYKGDLFIRLNDHLWRYKISK